MKRWYLLAALGCLAVNAQAVDPQHYPGLADIADQIRNGEINVGNKHTLSFEGRFHTIHAEALGMACTSCHSAPAYAKDHLYLRRAEFPRRGHPGPVGRAGCIGCHQQGGVATPWYGTAAR